MVFTLKKYILIDNTDSQKWARSANSISQQRHLSLSNVNQFCDESIDQYHRHINTTLSSFIRNNL